MLIHKDSISHYWLKDVFVIQVNGREHARQRRKNAALPASCQEFERAPI